MNHALYLVLFFFLSLLGSALLTSFKVWLTKVRGKTIASTPSDSATLKAFD